MNYFWNPQLKARVINSSKESQHLDRHQGSLRSQELDLVMNRKGQWGKQTLRTWGREETSSHNKDYPMLGILYYSEGLAWGSFNSQLFNSF